MEVNTEDAELTKTLIEDSVFTYSLETAIKTFSTNAFVLINSPTVEEKSGKRYWVEQKNITNIYFFLR